MSSGHTEFSGLTRVFISLFQTSGGVLVSILRISGKIVLQLETPKIVWGGLLQTSASNRIFSRL